GGDFMNGANAADLAIQRGAGIPAVHASHLSKPFGAKRVLQDLSFSVEPGDIVGVLGKNGRVLLAHRLRHRAPGEPRLDPQGRTIRLARRSRRPQGVDRAHPFAQHPAIARAAHDSQRRFRHAGGHVCHRDRAGLDGTRAARPGESDRGNRRGRIARPRGNLPGAQSMKAVLRLVFAYFWGTRFRRIFAALGLALCACAFVELVRPPYAESMLAVAWAGIVSLFVGTGLMPLMLGRMARSRAMPLTLLGST